MYIYIYNRNFFARLEIKSLLRSKETSSMKVVRKKRKEKERDNIGKAFKNEAISSICRIIRVHHRVMITYGTS